jgi:hypothetical protein
MNLHSGRAGMTFADWPTPDKPKSFTREVRYEVIKLSDAKAYLSKAETRALASIGAKVSAGRARDKKTPLKCVVVESDWPEYEPTWKAIEERMVDSSK